MIELLAEQSDRVLVSDRKGKVIEVFCSGDMALVLIIDSITYGRMLYHLCFDRDTQAFHFQMQLRAVNVPLSS